MAIHYGGETSRDVELFIVDWQGEDFQRISVIDPDCPSQRLDHIAWRKDLNRFSAEVSEQWVCEDPENRMGRAGRRGETYTIFIDPDTLEITEERQEQEYQRFTNLGEYDLEDGSGSVFLRKDRTNRPTYQWGFTLAESGEETITGEAQLGRGHTDVVYREGIGFYLLTGLFDYTLWSIDPLTGDQINVRDYQADQSRQGLMSVLADQKDQLLALYGDDVVHIPLNGGAPRTLAPITLHGESDFALTPNQRWFLHVNQFQLERIDAYSGQRLAIDSLQGDDWFLNTEECQFGFGPLNLSPSSDRFTLSTVNGGLSSGCPAVEGYIFPSHTNMTLIFESESLSYTTLEENRGYSPIFSPLGNRLAWFTEGEQERCYQLQVRDLDSDEDISIDNDLCVAEEHHWVVLPAGH